MLCDDPEEYDGGGGGREAQEGGDIYAYLQVIHVVWKKPIQYCKVVILQLKKKKRSA